MRHPYGVPRKPRQCDGAFAFVAACQARIRTSPDLIARRLLSPGVTPGVFCRPASSSGGVVVVRRRPSTSRCRRRRRRLRINSGICPKGLCKRVEYTERIKDAELAEAIGFGFQMTVRVNDV